MGCTWTGFPLPATRAIKRALLILLMFSSIVARADSEDIIPQKIATISRRTEANIRVLRLFGALSGLFLFDKRAYACLHLQIG